MTSGQRCYADLSALTMDLDAFLAQRPWCTWHTRDSMPMALRVVGPRRIEVSCYEQFDIHGPAAPLFAVDLYREAAQWPSLWGPPGLSRIYVAAAARIRYCSDLVATVRQRWEHASCLVILHPPD